MAAWNSVGKLAPASSSKITVLNSENQLEKRIAMEHPVLATNPEIEHQNLKQKQQQDEEDVEVDLSEVYFLIMHFLAGGPCKSATGQLWNELLQHKLLPRRYHAWHSSSGIPSGDEDDDGISFPLSYIQVMQRYPHIERNHLVKLLRQQLLGARRAVTPLEAPNSRIPTAADIPTLLGVGSFSLLDNERSSNETQSYPLLQRLRWPHWNCNQVHGLALRELGGGFSRHNRPPSIKSASYAIMKPSVLVDRIQITKKLRGHRNAVYCAIFDRNGQHIITGSDDRLVKIWSTETGFCLRSCRGHEGDITELSVSRSNNLVASASNDFTIRVWRLPDGVPVSVLRGHTAAVTAISFSPRCEHHLLSSSDDGTCRIWDALDSSLKSRVYVPNPELNNSATKPNVTSQPIQPIHVQIFCCSFNADGSIFVTGCSDKVARVWDARKWNDEITGKPNHEMDVLKGHENAVNYVQFSGCGGHLKTTMFENSKDDRTQKFKNSCLSRDSIVTCSRDGSAIIWVYKSRRKDARYGRWTKSYHLRVPPPPMPPNPPRGGGPRQRFLPTPRGVNMIVWSLDNRFVLAAIMDCRICVWNAVDGSLVHSLTGHSKSTFVVDVHPFNPRIAMSAGYDGRIIIWDIWEGRPVRVYETGDFQIVDGSFSPDGTSLVVSDEVGQVYLLSTGQGQSQKDAKYDQFFLGDFRPLVRDVHGNVLDQETQLPPHERNIRDLLCDASMIPYPEPYQSMYQQRRLGALGIEWHPLHINLAVGIDDINYAAFGEQVPMFQLNIQRSPAENRAGGGRRWVQQPVDADEEMDWEQETTRLSEDSESDYSVSEESLSLIDDEEERSASSTEEIVQSEGEDEVDDEDEQITEDNHPRRSNRNKRKAEDTPGSSHQRKNPRLPPKLNLYDESDEEDRDRRPIRQRHQGDSEPSSSRHDKKTPVMRPKRLAAKNALQMFSHIKNKGGEEEEEDDEQSSSHQDTSSYNGEPEFESDGLTPRFRRKNIVGWKREEEDEVLEGETMEDVPRSSGKEAVSDDEVPPIIMNETGTSRASPSKYDRCGSPRQGLPDIHEKAVSSDEDNNGIFGRTGKQDITNILEATHEPLETGDCSKRPRTQRRLILKLKKNEVETKGVVSKTELEDTDSDADASVQRLDQTLVSGENTKRKLRRLIVNPPPAAKPSCDNFRGFSENADKGNYSAAIPDNENSVQTGNPSIFGSRSEDYRSGFDQNQCQDGGDALPETSNPSSLSCSIDKPHSNSFAYQDGATYAYPQTMTNGSGSPDDDAISPAKRFLQPEIQRSESSKSQKSSSLQSSMKNHVSDTLCGPPFEETCHENGDMDRSFENELSNQVDIDPEVQYPGNRQWCPAFFRQSTPDAEQKAGLNNGANTRVGLRKGRKRVVHSAPKELDEQLDFENAQTSEEEECRYQAPIRVRISEEAQLDTSDNPRLGGNVVINGSVRSRRGRKTAPEVLEENVEAHQLQTSGEEDYKHHLPVHNNRRTAPPQGSKRTVVVKQLMNKAKNVRHGDASASMQSSSGDGFDVSQSSTEEPSGSYFDQDDGSWSENDSSQKHSHDAPILRNKRRTFGEIDSTNNYEDKTNGRHGIRKTRSALLRGKNEGLVNGRKGRRSQRPNNYNVDEDSDQEMEILDNRLSQSVDEQQVTNSNRRSKMDMERSGQDGASIQIERRTLRTSSRTKIDRSRGSDRDTRRQTVNLSVTRDKGIRTRKSLAWLLMSEVEDGNRYIPQFGDEVVYLRQGHEEYLKMYRIDEPGPWTVYQDDLRAVEICQVVELNYAVHEDSGETYCRFTLEFSDETSELYGKKFSLQLPELTDFPDFIVEKSRYDASRQRQWTTRDRCKVWWRSQNGQGGEWWEGRVVSVKPKSSMFPDSPWERFTVQYKSDPKPYSHSPWELFDLNEAQWEPPHIDSDTRDRMMSLLESAADDPKDAYGLRRLKQISCKSDFINRLSLPLTLDVLHQRLEKNYYHSSQAFYFDVNLLATNSEQYWGFEHPMTQGLQAFKNLVGSEIFSDPSS